MPRGRKHNKDLNSWYTWGVKARGTDIIIAYNMFKEEAERVVSACPDELRLAAISTRRCVPVHEKKEKLVHIDNLSFGDTL